MNHKKRALISVSHKEGIIELARFLVAKGYELISTGGTKKYLEQHQIPVLSVESITNFPEILDGRVKTLHPSIHAALLAKRTNTEHLASLQKFDIRLIEMLIVNLYPFRETITRQNVGLEEAIEQIDIGGPSMLRSAAKNFTDVSVLVDPNDYPKIMQEMDLDTKAQVSLTTRKYLAIKVFEHTAAYDAMIANYLHEKMSSPHSFPHTLTLTYEKIKDLRYGENPHQKAAFYRSTDTYAYSLAQAEQLSGKELSFNNIQDSEAALGLLRAFTCEVAFVAVKHANPCGVGLATNPLEAWVKTYEADKTSIFGGIVASNRVLDEEVARLMKDVFLEVVLAPDFTPEALAILQQKKNLRLLKVPMPTNGKVQDTKIVSLNGGLLVQDVDRHILDVSTLQYVTEYKPTEAQIQDLLFAYKVVHHVKSNAIVVASDLQTLGVGAGQMNRIGAAHLALEQAKAHGLSASLVLASDAFFPFKDVVELAHRYQVKAIIQPGGSLKDSESIDACNQYGMAMVFTGVRHFLH